MEIVLFPHPVLRFKSGDVQQIDDSLQHVVREMFDLMYAAKGVGLAANQVGIPLRFFLMNPTGDSAQKDAEQVLINPRIRKRSGQEVGEEGCLSLPGLHGDVCRPEQITYDAFDLDGHEVRGTLNQLPARIFQHEFDHLDGILFIDRIDEEEEFELLPDLAKFRESFLERQHTGEFAPLADMERLLRATSATGRLA